MFFKKKKPQEKPAEDASKEKKDQPKPEQQKSANSSKVDASKSKIESSTVQNTSKNSKRATSSQKKSRENLKTDQESEHEDNNSTTSIMQNSRIQEIQREYEMKKREIDGNRNVVPLDKEQIIMHLVERLEKAENSIAESQYSLAVEREHRNKLAFDLEEKSRQLDEVLRQQSNNLESKIRQELQKTLSIAAQAKLEAENKYNVAAAENMEKTLLISELDRQFLETRMENNYLRQQNQSMMEINKELELNFLEADNRKNEWMQRCQEKDYFIENLMREIAELKGTLTKFADVRLVLNRIMGAPDVITKKEKIILDEYNESYIRSMENNLAKAKPAEFGFNNPSYSTLQKSVPEGPIGYMNPQKKVASVLRSEVLNNDDDFWYSTAENMVARDYAGGGGGGKKYQSEPENAFTKFPPIPRKNSPSLNWDSGAAQREVRSGEESEMSLMLLNRLNALESKLYQKDLVLEFLKNTPIETIISDLVQKNVSEKVKPKIVDFLNVLIRDQDLYKTFLLSENKAHHDSLEKLISHSEESLRSLPALAISSHTSSFFSALKDLGERSPESLSFYMRLMFSSLSDPDSEVGLKIHKAFLNYGRSASRAQSMEIEGKPKDQPLWVFFNEDFLKHAEKGFQHKMDVVVLRHMEIVCTVSNYSEELFQRFREKGLLDKSLAVYNTDDILVKLNAVEILNCFGDSSWGCDYFAKSGMLDDVMKEALDPQSEFYVKKYLVLLLGKLIRSQVIEFNSLLQKKMMGFMLTHLQTKSVEENEGVLEVISVLSLSQKGVDFLVGDRALMAHYFEISKTTNQSLKKKFLASLSGFFNTGPPSSPVVKNTVMLRNVLMALGEPENLSQIKFQVTSEKGGEALKKSMNYIFALLFAPFQDIEFEALGLLNNLIAHEFALEEVCKHPKSIEYLVKHFAKTKEIFDLKNDIKRALTFWLKETKNAVIIEWAKSFTAEMAEQSNKNAKVEVGTEAD